MKEIHKAEKISKQFKNLKIIVAQSIFAIFLAFIQFISYICSAYRQQRPDMGFGGGYADIIEAFT